MLNNAMLTDYCATFAGYGQWRAPIWFIGIEEAGGQTEAAVASHLNTWHQRKRKDLESAPEFYPASGKAAWHDGNAIPQPTWAQLIRMLLLSQGTLDSPRAILDYQRNRLGSTEGETCLLELFPLPSPNLATWNYADWSESPWLKCRQTYEQHVINQRISLLRQRIDAWRPRVVIFYGDGQLKHWRQIMGAGTYTRPIRDKVIAHARDNISLFVTKHPTDPNLSPQRDDYFREMGHFFHDNYGDRFFCHI
jgi:hypothetical protein